MDNDAKKSTLKGRNIVMCFDGTGDWVSRHQTNVFQIYDILDKSDPDRQICFYSGGVGTLSNAAELSAIRRTYLKILDLATATSLHEKTMEGYRFLIENYRPGDNIYLLGFSRGAFTARLLAAMVYRFGILERTNSHLTPYLWESISMVKDIVAFKEESLKQKARFAQPDSDQIKFLGLFDTVSSVGVFERFKIFPYTDRNPNVAIVRHAVSKDESRNAFPELLITPDGNDVVELWFDGVHRDIGGGGKGNQTISKHTLSWMAKSCNEAGMVFKEPPPEPPPVTKSGETSWKVNQPLFDPYVFAGLYPMHMYDFSLKRRVIPAIAKIGESIEKAGPVGRLIHRWFFPKDPGFRYIWPNFKHRRIPPDNAHFYDPHQEKIQTQSNAGQAELLSPKLSDKPEYEPEKHYSNPVLEFLATLLGCGLAFLVLNRGLPIGKENYLFGESWPSLTKIPFLQETSVVCVGALIAYMILQGFVQRWHGTKKEITIVSFGALALIGYLGFAYFQTTSLQGGVPQEVWPALAPAAIFASVVALFANIPFGKVPKLPADRAIAVFIVPWSILVFCAWAASKILPLVITAVNKLFDTAFAQIDPNQVNTAAWVVAGYLGLASLTRIVLDRIKRMPEKPPQPSSKLNRAVLSESTKANETESETVSH